MARQEILRQLGESGSLSVSTGGNLKCSGPCWAHVIIRIQADGAGASAILILHLTRRDQARPHTLYPTLMPTLRTTLSA